jgi:hypothetical protein
MRTRGDWTLTDRQFAAVEMLVGGHCEGEVEDRLDLPWGGFDGRETPICAFGWPWRGGRRQKGQISWDFCGILKAVMEGVHD